MAERITITQQILTRRPLAVAVLVVVGAALSGCSTAAANAVTAADETVPAVAQDLAITTTTIGATTTVSSVIDRPAVPPEWLEYCEQSVSPGPIETVAEAATSFRALLAVAPAGIRSDLQLLVAALEAMPDGPWEGFSADNLDSTALDAFTRQITSFHEVCLYGQPTVGPLISRPSFTG